MKRIATMLALVLLLWSLAGCGQPSDSMPDTDETGQDAALSEEDIFATADRLVARGRTVFFWYFSEFSSELGIDIEDEIIDPEGDGSYWQAVGIFDTMAELEAETEAVFTLRFCERELYDKIKLGKFREFDGVLYHNQNVGGMSFYYAPPKEWRVISASDTLIQLTGVCEGPNFESGDFDNTVDYEMPFDLVYENGGWRLDNFYEYGKLPVARVEKTVTALLAAGLISSSWDNVEQTVQPGDHSLITFYCYLKSSYDEIQTDRFEARMENDFGLSRDFLHQLEEYDPETDTYQVHPDILVTEDYPYDTFLRVDAIEELDNDGLLLVRYRVLWGPMAGEGDGSDTAYAGDILLDQMGDYFIIRSVTVTADFMDKYD